MFDERDYNTLKNRVRKLEIMPKFTPGTLLPALELGRFEFTDDGTNGHLYFTQNVNGVITRTQIV